MLHSRRQTLRMGAREYGELDTPDRASMACPRDRSLEWLSITSMASSLKRGKTASSVNPERFLPLLRIRLGSASILRTKPLRYSWSAEAPLCHHGYRNKEGYRWMRECRCSYRIPGLLDRLERIFIARFLEAQMPLAHHGGVIALGLQERGNGHLPLLYQWFSRPLSNVGAKWIPSS